MFRTRAVWVVVLVALLGAAGTACSSDDAPAQPTERGPLAFGTPPEEATRLGLCAFYETEKIADIMGSENFRRLPPAAIGEEGDAVIGETCRWERRGGGTAVASLQIDVEDYGDDAAALTADFDAGRAEATGAADVPAMGDGAYSGGSASATTLVVRSGQYLFTLVSRVEGDPDESLTALDVPTLQILAAPAVQGIS